MKKYTEQELKDKILDFAKSVKDEFEISENSCKSDIDEVLKKQGYLNKIEVGKVYLSKSGGIYFCESIEWDYVHGYGLNRAEQWFKGCCCRVDNIKREATESEWLEALKKEAIRRGYDKLEETLNKAIDELNKILNA